MGCKLLRSIDGGLSFSTTGSARGRGERRPMLEVTHITAAYYECNFGHIVLGHSGKKAGAVSDSGNSRLCLYTGR